MVNEMSDVVMATGFVLAMLCVGTGSVVAIASMILRNFDVAIVGIGAVGAGLCIFLSFALVSLLCCLFVDGRNHNGENHMDA